MTQFSTSSMSHKEVVFPTEYVPPPPTELLSQRRVSQPSRMAESREYEAHGCLHEWFSREVYQYYERTAVWYEGRSQTFRELDHNSTLLANHLRLACGVQVGDIVGMYLPKCLSYPAAYIGILKAGAAYLPIDTSYPRSLLRDVIADSRPRAVLTTDTLRPALDGVYDDNRVLVLDDEGVWTEDLEQEEDPGPLPPLPLDSLAYTVYSSGTTGKPKGIMCPHRGAVFSYHCRFTQTPYGEGEREACNVFFVWEMMRPLLKGVTLYIIPETTIYDPKELLRYLGTHRITRILFTPSLLETVLNTSLEDSGGLSRHLPHLRTVILCGEVVSTRLRERAVAEFKSTRFINLYSVSECHDIATEDLSAWTPPAEGRKFCPVGRLLPGVHVLILDEGMRLHPVGVAGEIYVAGPTLAIGYLNRAELTAAKFVPRPEGVPAGFGERLYRTGDWGYLLANDKLEICGRCDSMVKIRGYSIETKAVEAALMRLPSVQNCVVIAEGAETEDRYLVAYLIPKDPGGISKRDLRTGLKTLLPFYMIPQTFVFLDKLPVVLASGKLDKKSLTAAAAGKQHVPLKPQISRSSFSSSFDTGEAELDPDCQPTTPTERQLYKIWRKVLRMRSIDVMESFFDLGGHSLGAAQMLNQVQEHMHVELRVQDLFDHPSIVQLAKLVDARRTGGGGRTPEGVPPVVELELQEEVNKYDQAEVNFDMQLRAFWRSFSLLDTKWRRANVLLSGATGFLGAFLLQELLLNTKCHVFCVVRASAAGRGEPENVRARVQRTLERAQVVCREGQPTEQQQRAQDAMDSRVTVIKADVSLDMLGVDEETYSMLCYEVDIIIHAAAQVNLIYPYAALRRANVFGTVNMIKLASTAKVKPLHYLSTNAVFPPRPAAAAAAAAAPAASGDTEEEDGGYREDADMAEFATDLEEGYAQSKWVAEQLVYRARDRGLPTVVYRPGNICGDRKNVFWNPQDFNLMVLRALTATRAAPGDAPWRLEMTPADFIAQFVVRCMHNIRAFNGHTFHLVQPHPLPSHTLYTWMENYGYELARKPTAQWIQELEAVPGDDLAETRGLLGDMYKSGSLFKLENTVFSTTNTRQALDTLNNGGGGGGGGGQTEPPKYPELDNDLLTHYFNKLVSNGLLHPPTNLKLGWTMAGTAAGSVQGRVVIVTGASSGIGREVAALLASHGAKVALVARRAERLAEAAALIERGGQGSAIPVQADVSERASVDAMVQEVELKLGPVDALVNNAGYMYFTEMADCNYEAWERTVDVNIRALNYCIGAVLPGMIKRKRGGHIVNTSSDAGRRGFPGLAVYSGSKFYVEGLSQALRHEVKQHGIRVTTVQPGDVRTELISHSTDMAAREKYDGSLAGGHPILNPRDVAHAVLYALSQPDHVAVNQLLIEPTMAPI